MRCSKPPPVMSSSCAAFVPVVGVAMPGGNVNREPSKQARRKSETGVRNEKAHGKRDNNANSAPVARTNPAPSVMNALVAAWLQDAAGKPPSAPEKGGGGGWGVFGFVMRGFRRSEESPGAKSSPSGAKAGPRKGKKRAADDSDDMENTSPLYRSLYFAATHTRSPSARSLARQMCSQHPSTAAECVRNATVLSQRGNNVPSFLLADDSPAGQGLLEEIREAWRTNISLNGRGTGAEKRSLGKVLTTSISFVFFVLNPFQ